MPAAVIPGECVHLVDDDGAHPGEEPPGVDRPRHQHGLQRLGGGQEEVGRVAREPSPRGGKDVAVPERRPPSEPARIRRQAGLEVVEQRAERTDVEH
jgi:hypothetical protein